MKISGFTFVKNATKLYYPIKAVIESILPIVDEFVVALGECDEDDETRSVIEGIGSSKIRIIDTVWNLNDFPDGMENAHQTDIAKENCIGDWLFYLQADEVVHEKFLPLIRDRCEELLDDYRVEGMLFDYIHFFGDYQHFNNAHGWYPNEIRIVRNDQEIHSFQSAQSFRRIPGFDGRSYRKKEGTHKLKVARIDASIYHYGWVRPPRLMQKKSKALDTIHKGQHIAGEIYKKRDELFDYGDLESLPEFLDTHPMIMTEVIEQFDWKDQLHYGSGHKPNRKKMKHEIFKNKVLTYLEQRLLGGRQIFGYSNWDIVR